MRVLITGMLGFIGHHVAEHLLANTDWELVGLDRVDETSTYHRMRWLECWPDCAKRCTFVWHDLRAPINHSVSQAIGRVDAAFHLAASTHVDRSITDPMTFVHDNVIGTAHLLEWYRRRLTGNFFVQFSTDEVFGPAEDGQAFKEWDRYRSANPYSATKAAGEEFACAWSNTYKFKVAVTHGMNLIGERQHPEKFVPMVVRKVLSGEEVVVHADSTETRSGSRFYLHAANVGPVLQWLCEHQNEFPLFDKWNVVGEHEVTNLEMANMIAEIVGKPLRYRLVDAQTSRPGHDLRYALDGSKLADAGFQYPISFEAGLERTVKWFLEHREWLEQ